MPGLFTDPTPRVERGDRFCTVASVGENSTTHTGKDGVVSWMGRNYAATLIGIFEPGCRAHFIQTSDGHVWAIKSGSYYRSAYPKLPQTWAKKCPASLAVLELMRKNPRNRVFQSCRIAAAGTGSATVSMRGRTVSLPSNFAGVTRSVSGSDVGKIGLVFGEELVTFKNEGAPMTLTVTHRIREIYNGHSSLIDYGPPSSSDAYVAAVTGHRIAMSVPIPLADLKARMAGAGYDGFTVLYFEQTSITGGSESYSQQGSPPPLESEYTSFTKEATFSVGAESSSQGVMPSLRFEDTYTYGPFA